MIDKRYSTEFKMKVVKDVITSEKSRGLQTRIAEKYGISKSAVSAWKRKYEGRLKSELYKNGGYSLSKEDCQNRIIREENEKLKRILIEKELYINDLKALL